MLHSARTAPSFHEFALLAGISPQTRAFSLANRLKPVTPIEKALCPESEHRIQSIEEFSAGILQSQQGNTSVFSIKANETLILDEQTRVLGKAVRPDSEKTMVVPEKPKTSAKKKPARSWSRKKLALALSESELDEQKEVVP